MRILLTGASSFTGFWFATKLAALGAEVVAPLRADIPTYTGIRRRRVEQLQKIAEIVPNVIFGDKAFIDIISRRSFDVFCHHAAVVSNYRSQDFNAIAAVAEITNNLSVALKIFMKNGLQSVVYTGSVFEQDTGVGNPPLAAFSPYGLSKGLTWQVVRYWCETLGIRAAKFVIPNPFGPYEEERFCSYLVKSWKMGQIANIRTPEYIRDNIHVDLLALTYANFVTETANNNAVCQFGPCGYIESQGQFAHRVSRELSSRLGIDAPIRLIPQMDFPEPLVRFNTNLIKPDVYNWSESDAWDAIATYYSQ